MVPFDPPSLQKRRNQHHRTSQVGCMQIAWLAVEGQQVRLLVGIVILGFRFQSLLLGEQDRECDGASCMWD